MRLLGTCRGCKQPVEAAVGETSPYFAIGGVLRQVPVGWYEPGTVYPHRCTK